MLRTLPDAGADIAVVGVARDDLISTGVIVKRPSTRALKIRSITSLKNDVGKLGSTTPSATGIPLYVLRYFPRFQSLPQIGTLFHVVKTQSLTSGAFGQGRSGALWQIGRQVAAHQVFAWQAGDYKQAGGQSLHYALRWVQTELANSHHVRKSDVTMRIVRFL